MDDFRKTLIMLSAAATMSALGTQAAMAGGKRAKKAPAGKDKVERTKGKKVTKKKVKRVKRARKRAPRNSHDFAMPAGTAYDVISSRDLP